VTAAVFLDRDGVLNKAFVRDGKPYPPMTMDEFELLPGVEGALDDLSAAGYRLVVVTNQPDVRTGKQSRAMVERFHDLLRARLPLDGIFACYHVDADPCDCRKPKPGMLRQAAREFGIDLARSFMVGDRWRDVYAGAAAGCATFWVDHGYSEAWPEGESVDYVRVDSLAEASERILARRETVV
jgi:D-glycero-D-manno-heptose 1,7-bisphosphate phosphatase